MRETFDSNEVLDVESGGTELALLAELVNDTYEIVIIVSVCDRVACFADVSSVTDAEVDELNRPEGVGSVLLKFMVID